MEDTEAYSVEDLLNFQGLEVEDDDDDKLKNPSSFSTISNPDDDSTPSFPDNAEEELEWLDKDAFPNIDTFVDIISVNPGCAPKNHRSPVSVLENSSCSSNSISTNSTTIMTTCSGGFPAPIRRARTNRRRRHRRGGFADLPSQHWWWVSDQVKTYGKGTMTTVTKASTSSIGRKCQHCGAEKTPQWRAGPMGPKTLCNACGVRYKSGRLVPEYRPASSPTFSSQLHSNSHRKIVEMRRLKQNNMMVNNTSVDTG